ncbi:hypothetical protein FQN55_003706 [Onygenales sp. PD_40]|nr:hypothetical protein FQN55_003706 [Onygenales sp. PD_40]
MSTPPPIPKSTHLHYLRACLSLAKQSPPKPTNFRVGAILLSRHQQQQPATTTTTTTTTPSDDPHLQTDTILSTGYTLELPGNTHAEQCALAKYAAANGLSEERVGEVLPPPPPAPATATATATEDSPLIVLYVTMEPCGLRLSGNLPCVQRIIRTREGAGAGTDAQLGAGEEGRGRRGRRGIDKVYFGVKEPGTFVGGSVGCRMMDEVGVEWEVVSGLEEEILEVAMAGHEKGGEEGVKGKGDGEEVVVDIENISEEERRRQEAMPRNPKKRMMEADI